MDMTIAVYRSEDASVHINGIEIAGMDSVVIELDANLCKCGMASDFGGHGVKDGKVYDEYYCKECYHKEHE
jgi:hypothetical protein